VQDFLQLVDNRDQALSQTFSFTIHRVEIRDWRRLICAQNLSARLSYRKNAWFSEQGRLVFPSANKASSSFQALIVCQLLNRAIRPKADKTGCPSHWWPQVVPSSRPQVTAI
jgi:hypothetical protein